MELPIRTFDTLYHFGTFNINDRKSESYEGNTLSVSVHPETWMRIMEQGGDVWETTNPVRLIDLNKFMCENKNEICNWCLDNGYVTEASEYRLYHYDEELDSVVYSQFNSMEELQDELDGWEDETVTVSSVEEANEKAMTTQFCILVHPGFQYTDAGKEYTRGQTESIADDNIMAMIYVENNLKDTCNIDGGWWHSDVVDALRYTAPAGGIFLDKVNDFTWNKISYGCDEENIQVPEIHNEEMSPGMKI